MLTTASSVTELQIFSKKQSTRDSINTCTIASINMCNLEVITPIFNH